MTRLQTLLNECREAVVDGNISAALVSLSNAMPEMDRAMHNEAILHRAKLKRLEEQERQGTLSPSDAQVQRNQITQSVLQFLDLAAERVGRTSSRSTPPVAPTTTGGSCDAFLSHCSRDKPVVREIAQQLEARGLRVWLDEKDLPAGQLWIPQLEQGIRDAKAVVVLIGAGDLGPWQKAEMWLGLRKAFERGIAIVPVWLPGVTTPPTLPEFLTLFTWVDFSLGINADGLDRLVRAVKI